MSYYDFAIEYVKRLGYPENLVNKESCKSIVLKPPLSTSLSTTQLCKYEFEISY